ncbi:MAG: type I methionyl aminopeptidase [Propionibacteriaceae bacterium]|nr:type I methionyl aminopeptidase [Propionibacteriaceae bacterium]
MAVYVKTAEQIRAMRPAGLVTGQILTQLRAATVPGVTPKQLDALAAELIAQAGAKSSFLNYVPYAGCVPFPAVTCISVNDTVVHGIPDARPLALGDLVSIDFGVSIDGWHGDSAVSFLVGEPDAGVSRRLNQATYEALWAGIAQARVGNRLGDVGHAIATTIRKADRRFSVVRDFTGHGIGRAMHEDPDVPNYGRPDKGMRIEEGLVIAIEPIISAGSGRTVEIDDGWTIKTADKSVASHFEHTVAITKAGVWVLTSADGGESECAARSIPFAPLL